LFDKVKGVFIEGLSGRRRRGFFPELSCLPDLPEPEAHLGNMERPQFFDDVFPVETDLLEPDGGVHCNKELVVPQADGRHMEGEGFAEKDRPFSPYPLERESPFNAEALYKGGYETSDPLHTACAFRLLS